MLETFWKKLEKKEGCSIHEVHNYIFNAATSCTECYMFILMSMRYQFAVYKLLFRSGARFRKNNDTRSSTSTASTAATVLVTGINGI